MDDVMALVSAQDEQEMDDPQEVLVAGSDEEFDELEGDENGMAITKMTNH